MVVTDRTCEHRFSTAGSGGWKREERADVRRPTATIFLLSTQRTIRVSPPACTERAVLP